MGYSLNDKVNYHSICEIDQNVCFSDHVSHCIYKTDFFRSKFICVSSTGR